MQSSFSVFRLDFKIMLIIVIDIKTNLSYDVHDNNKVHLISNIENTQSNYRILAEYKKH